MVSSPVRPAALCSACLRASPGFAEYRACISFLRS
ncbi:secreted protein [gut metagenome]|uniref:Secreted protein n=1 Tax=gut metagenome TaxID=749906 RepID=J9FLA5_9ZZZZ